MSSPLPILIKLMPPVIKTYPNGKKKTRKVGLYKCFCGNGFIALFDNVGKGRTTVSCGCKLKSIQDSIGDKAKKHGMSGTKEYHCWVDMKERCYNSKNKAFKRYGKRGIEVCKEWRYSFETFFNDMGICPADKYSIDRIDVNKGYSKENCRWASFEEQSNNKTTNRYLVLNGVKKTMKQWISNPPITINYDTLRYRLKRGWSDYDALTTPVRKMKK